MNPIQNQAREFLMYNDSHNYFGMPEAHRTYLEEVKTRLYDYRKPVHKVEFLEFIKTTLKKEFDHHLPCPGCDADRFFENVLFHVQEEIESIETDFDSSAFRISEKEKISETLQQIVSDINKLQLGQELTYTDLDAAISELKTLYYLNKQNWTHLLIGKLTEMVAGGLIEETVSKAILDTIKLKYPNLII
jgi:hypothetical protein